MIGCFYACKHVSHLSYHRETFTCYGIDLGAAPAKYLVGSGPMRVERSAQIVNNYSCDPDRYCGVDLDELSLSPGDILRPDTALEPGWWAGQVVFPANNQRAGQWGVFPANYVCCFK